MANVFLILITVAQTNHRHEMNPELKAVVFTMFSFVYVIILIKTNQTYQLYNEA